MLPDRYGTVLSINERCEGAAFVAKNGWDMGLGAATINRLENRRRKIGRLKIGRPRIGRLMRGCLIGGALSFALSACASYQSLQLDTHAQEEMAKKAVQQKLEDQLKNKAVEGLKNLFKKP